MFNSVVKPQLTSPSPLSLLTPLPQRLSNGSLESAHEASQVVELQDLLEKQNYELAQMKERMSSLSSRVSEVEQELETARKDLIKSEEMNNKYQRDIKEVTARTYLPKKRGITVAGERERETSNTAQNKLLLAYTLTHSPPPLPLDMSITHTL